MSRKAICLLDKEPEIKSLVEEITAKNKQRDDEIEFLTKKAKQIKDRIDEERKVIWKKLHDHCEERGLLPAGFKFESEDNNMGFDLETGVLYYEIHTAGDCDCALHRGLRGGKGDGFQSVILGGGNLPPELGALFSSLFGKKPSNNDDSSPKKGD